MLINVCRVCGRSRLCPKAVQLFQPGRQDTLRRIQLITGIRLQQLPNAPDMVCFCCQTDLNSAMMFRRQCILEQKKWVPLEKAEKKEEPKDEPKEEPKDTVPPKRKYQRRNLRSMMPVEVVDIVISTENKPSEEATGGDDEFDQPVEISGEPETTEGDVNLLEIDIKEEVILPKDEEDLEPEYELPKVQLHKCDTCGVIKNSKPSLDRHQFEHTGERPFACKECPKTFLAKSELEAHNLTHHTADPPFACRYCERRYFSTVGRKKHERVHTNERPFVCDQCGKAFTRTCILKAHMESHRIFKKFSCDVCDRSFSLKKHLVTHFISNTHKQNAEMATSSSESMSMVSFETDETWSQSTQVASPIDDEEVQSQFESLCHET